MNNAKIIIMSFFVLVVVHLAYAAVGCTLNDPERDIKRLFPGSTGYKTFYITIKEQGGEALKKEIELELGDTLEPVYESIDVPYTFYTVLKGKDVIGYVHGVNQKGKYGGMQLILSSDLDNKTIDFYFQKMSSPEAGKFMDKRFADQFKGLTLDNFMKNSASIDDPTEKSHEDFKATLRGIKKNLILIRKLYLKDGHRFSPETSGKADLK
ncbi:MAG: hypothetical protein WC695_01145 [Candidatus Omnitrophota bacterium]